MSNPEKKPESAVDIEIPPTVSNEENYLHEIHASSAVPSNESVLLIDPKFIRISKDPNRSPKSFEDIDFEQLCISIGAVGMNLTPIHVTRRTDASTALGDITQYDLLGGERRVRACIENKLKVRAIVMDTSVSGNTGLDRLLENVCRKDLSPLEFGQQIMHILASDESLSLGRIAAKIGRDKSLLSRAVELAKTPAELIEAFPDPSALRYSDAKPLQEAWLKNPEAVREEIKAIRAGEQIRHSEIVQRIKNAAQNSQRDGGVARCNTPIQMTTAGMEIGQISTDKQGMTQIAMSLQLTQKHNDMLREHIEAFVKRHVLKKPRSKTGTKNASQKKHTEPSGGGNDADSEIESTSQGKAK